MMKCGLIAALLFFSAASHFMTEKGDEEKMVKHVCPHGHSRVGK
jgi:hypothetical protein